MEVAPQSWGWVGLNKEKSRYGQRVFLGAAETELASGMWLCRKGNEGAAPCPNPSVQSPNGAKGEDKGRLLLFGITCVSHPAPPGSATETSASHRCCIAQALMQPGTLGLTPDLCSPRRHPWEMHNPAEPTAPTLPLSQNKA